MGLAIVVSVHAVAFELPPEGVYKIENKNSGKFVAVAGGDTQRGADVIQWQDNDQEDIKWELVFAGDGYFKIKNRNSGKFLAVAGGGTTNGADIIQWDDNNQEDVKWEPIHVEDAYYKFKNKNSGKFLAVAGGVTANGADIIQWDDNNQEDVKWKLTLVQLTRGGITGIDELMGTRGIASLLEGLEAGDLDVSTLKHWDFEDGTLQGFRHEDAPGGGAAGAFHNQPTFGDNVRASRALKADRMQLPPNPCAGLVLDEANTCSDGAGATYYYLARLRRDLDRLQNDVTTVGGDYWDTPFPIGSQGLYWIGTHENRPSRRIPIESIPGRRRPVARPWGSVQGDRLTGRLVSPEIELQQRYFHFLVGGGCSAEVGVYLQILGDRIEGPVTSLPVFPGRPNPRLTTTWQTARDASGNPVEARGFCVENMVRVSFDIGNLRGKKARILIEDRATGDWGHINVDDIWLTETPPQTNRRDTDPVWGVADLHAHLMNELGFAAYSGDDTPEARALWGSAFGGIETLGGCNDTHTTNNHYFNPHQDEALGTTYTLCRDVCLNMLEGAGLPDHPGDQVAQDGWLGGYHNTQNSGYPYFVNWPMWYSAIHQQMHWTWVRRAYQGGVRMMIAAIGNSELIAFGLTKEKNRPFTSDQDAIAMQIPAIREFERQNSTWVEVADTPRDARRIVNMGKLALLIGVELDHVMDSCSANVTARPRHHKARELATPENWALVNGYDPGTAGTIAGFSRFLGATTHIMNYGRHPGSCTDAQIENRIEALYQQGVRHIIPIHFSDNMLGGYALDDGKLVASAVFGDPAAHPPKLMQQDELRRRFGARVDPFVPEPREAYYGENERRLQAWKDALPFTFKLSDVWVPVWARLVGPDEPLRTAIMPYEGATESPAMIPLGLNTDQRDLPFHLNARDLQPQGRTFVREMMRRGMLIDIQHSSEKTKSDILSLTGSYPVMASHGGVQAPGTTQRTNENTLSRSQFEQIYSPPDGFAGGLVGIGTQSSLALRYQIRTVATDDLSPGERRERMLHTRGVGLGTDFNGMDWHAAPRFGKFGYYHETPEERYRRQRDGRLTSRVNYVDYSGGTNPWSSTIPTCNPACSGWTAGASGHTPLNPLQITRSGHVTRTFDINYDGLAHYGLIPDFLQELSVLGTEPEEMGAVFRSAEALIRMWEESCRLAYQSPSAPSIVRGCGGPENYR